MVQLFPEAVKRSRFSIRPGNGILPQGFADYLNVPWKRSENAIQFFKKELERVSKHLEAFAGRKMSPDDLNHAIIHFNKHRSLLKKIYDLRKAESPPVSGLDAFYVTMSGFILPKERHMRLMEQCLAEIEAAPAVNGHRVRLLISGGCVIDADLWKLIESCGALIVADDVNNGARSIWPNVAEGGDPLDALARAYIQRPCGFNSLISTRFAFIKERIVTHRVQGVIFAINKHCESEAFDYPQLEKKIREELKVATLLVETDYLNQTEPLRTRIEAFVEMLG
ncbi:MAG: 2-hydroxyacyl-CoA dehydratase family protein [Deltaproteobacteria bacterium]|nr:2-hydroxyacyl-CoA dehydratase family protein [Deltaproteobacteria bacterium]